MGRLMPGRIRQEGIDLYEKGQLKVKKIEDRRLFVKVGEADFAYSLEEGLLSCSCALFAQKGYCQHLAAVEYFLKNDSEGRGLATQLTQADQTHSQIAHRVYEGSLFLDRILEVRQISEVKYQLSVEGQLHLFDKNIEWTLKINRFPDQRFYIIRDIGAFLQTVKLGGYYQIGKHFYEPISVQQFDPASQEVLDFLWRLVPEKSMLTSDVLVNVGRHLRLPPASFEEGLDVLMGLASFQFSHQLMSYSHLTILPLDEKSGCFTFEVKQRPYLIELRISEGSYQELFNGRYLLRGNHLYRLEQDQERLLAAIRELAVSESGLRKMEFDVQDRERLALSLLDLQKIGKVKAPKQFLIRDFQAQFHFDLAEDGGLSLQLVLDFKGHIVSSQEALRHLPFAYHFQHLVAIEGLIRQSGFSGTFEARRSPLIKEDWYPFFSQILPAFRAMGEVVLSSDLEDKFLTARPQIQVDTAGSLLDISFDFAGIDEEEIDEALQALLQDQSHFTSRTGQVFFFDEESQKISQTLKNLRAKLKQDGHLSISRLASYQLAEVFREEGYVQFSEDFLQLAYDLAHPEDFALPELAVKASLRDYQLLGVRWLSMLDSYGFGGILADDMGLGKTLQALAFLASRVTEESRVLILTPSSLLYNWQSECQRFAPQLDVAVIYGSRDKREALIREQHQLEITSYSAFRQDRELYQKQRYDYLILDEAQVMKNAQTKIAQFLREFEVGNCFALSGTPIENHLTELWSIFQIVLPGLLPPKNRFCQLRAEEVARMTRPFILRRRKEEVLQELPGLMEMTVLNELAEEQKIIYLAQLRQMQEQLSTATSAEIQGKKIEILAGITRLRQICDTPRLFMEDYQGKSGKLEGLSDLLLQLKEGGHRVLVFSQFRKMLDIIEEQMEDLGLTSYKLTGSTPAQLRQEMISSFNKGSRDAFLISLKAGGVGLNLTGADSVILVDLWWNPAVEAQAISRAHRMGQTEKVECYRLITRGSIEEKIQALQESKRDLVTTVLDGNESRASMTVEEIRDILGIE